MTQRPTRPSTSGGNSSSGESPSQTWTRTFEGQGPCLSSRLARVAARGWAEVDEENEVGVRSIAAAVPDPDGHGRPRPAVSLGATVVLTSAEELRTHVPALLDCAEEIAAVMG
ncbi:IclR family transcriptional regulator domain-containing protein [Streptomyces smyrnaeus]|uniref:IclR family transcriptional regulator domain-containing protein n=1 Tax=Streptomyces smyrnaeus TaxID=1387713 RepID=UPI0033D7A429